jgi:hypothetical protein
MTLGKDTVSGSDFNWTHLWSNNRDTFYLHMTELGVFLAFCCFGIVLVATAKFLNFGYMKKLNYYTETYMDGDISR